MKTTMRDAGLQASISLPVGATPVVSNALDIGPVSSFGSYAPSINGEFLLEAPALTVAQLPNGESVAYDVVTSVNPDLSSPVIVSGSAVVQLGAGGVGAVGNSVRVRPTSDVLRYFGFQARGTSGVAASGVKATLTYII